MKSVLRALRDGLSRFASSRSVSPVPASIPRVEPETHDLSMRTWGRNYNILSVKNEGLQLEVALWATPLPSVDDYLLLKGPDGTSRYQVTRMKYCGNPRDMAFASLVFAPRPAKEVQP